MARLSKGILSAFSGKFGSVVGRKLKGRAVITSLHSTPKSKRSALQLKVEKSLGQVRGLGGSVYESILVHLISVGNQKTTILSEFVKRNFVFFNIAVNPIYQLLEFSVGQLLSTPIKNTTLSVQHQRVRVTWNQNWVTGSKLQNSFAFVVIIDTVSGSSYASDYGTIRQEKQIDIFMPINSNNQDLQVYLMFNAGNSTSVSNTEYYHSV